jgi:hypothetical protein
MKDIIKYVIKRSCFLQSTSDSHVICGSNGVRIEFTSIGFLAKNLEENTLLYFKDRNWICQCMDLRGDSESFNHPSQLFGIPQRNTSGHTTEEITIIA